MIIRKIATDKIHGEQARLSIIRYQEVKFTVQGMLKKDNFLSRGSGKMPSHRPPLPAKGTPTPGPKHN